MSEITNTDNAITQATGHSPFIRLLEEKLINKCSIAALPQTQLMDIHSGSASRGGETLSQYVEICLVIFPISKEMLFMYQDVSCLTTPRDRDWAQKDEI